MKLFITLTAILVLAGVPVLAGAQASVPGANETILGGGPNGVIALIETITNWLFTVLLVLAVLFIILAAYRYLISGGGEDVGKAHKMILYAAVAIAVAFLAKGIVFVIAELVTGGSGASSVSAPANNGNGSLQIQYNGKNFGGGVNIPL